MPVYDPRTGKDIPDAVETQSEETIGGITAPLEGMQLAGHDGLVFVAVSARKIDGRTHLFVRDEALLNAVSALTFAIAELSDQLRTR